jgi:hypothetical protein
MSSLLEKALEKVGELAPEEQDAIACQIVDSLEAEAPWKKRFAAWPAKPWMTTPEGKRCRWTTCFDAIADHRAFGRY